MDERVRPGRGWYVIAALTFVICVGGGIALFVSSILDVLPKGMQFLVPGSTTITVERAGKYVLWHDARTVYRGRVFNKPKELPDGVEISLKSRDSGERVTMESNPSMSYSSGSHQSYSIANFDIGTPGEYELVVSGDIDEMVFSFGRSRLFEIIAGIAGGVALQLIGLVGASVLAVVVFIKRVQAKRRLVGQSS